jgi:hypothetical protein
MRIIDAKKHFQSKPYFNELVQAALVICGLFICKFAYSHLKNDLKWHFSSQNWTYYLRIQDSRSKMTERIYRE